ncbi:hypothetical protein PoB_000667100 [Plakobranchus ocellatus]|uniref:Uncharacterized protein n=1 Tax=Plakobranchus ocellatus TaxID=259542 RepID=A0AAV3XYZ4_9GAST|nr:hypothetical protein PoB_000667100 [Plakobranchus ocellatus]
MLKWIQSYPKLITSDTEMPDPTTSLSDRGNSKLSLLFFPCISSQRLPHILSLELKVLCLCNSQSVLPAVQLLVCASSHAAPSLCYQQCSSQSEPPV